MFGDEVIFFGGAAQGSAAEPSLESEAVLVRVSRWSADPAHGALAHRAPPPRCTADPMHMCGTGGPSPSLRSLLMRWHARHPVPTTCWRHSCARSAGALGRGCCSTRRAHRSCSGVGRSQYRCCLRTALGTRAWRRRRAPVSPCSPPCAAAASATRSRRRPPRGLPHSRARRVVKTSTPAPSSAGGAAMRAARPRFASSRARTTADPSLLSAHSTQRRARCTCGLRAWRGAAAAAGCFGTEVGWAAVSHRSCSSARSAPRSARCIGCCGAAGTSGSPLTPASASCRWETVLLPPPPTCLI